MSFGDLYTVQPGQDVGVGPPVDLPSIGEQPRQRIRIPVPVGPSDTAPIEPKQVKTRSITDPWAGARDEGPSTAQPEAAAGSKGDVWAGARDAGPNADRQEARDVGFIEAAGRGAMNALTFGAAPAITGLSEVGGTARLAAEVQQDPLGPNLGDIAAPFIGAAKMLHGYLSGHEDPTVRGAYERGRQEALNNEKLAQEQQPVAYIGGQLVGALAGAGKAKALAEGATALPRIIQAIRSGAIGGTLYGAGSATSEGGDTGDILRQSALEGLTGGVLGGVGGAALEGAGNLARKAIKAYRGSTDTDAEAASRILEATKKDWENKGLPFTLEEYQAARSAGTPISLQDYGRENVRALARSAANTSPEAREALTELADRRFAQQSERIKNWIRSKTGAGDTTGDLEALRDAAAKANRPAYAYAYRQGSRGLWSPELERLAGSGAVVDAIKGAAARANDRAIASGFGAFNPSVTFKNGIVKISRKGGTPTHPDLQFWDYVQRELRDAASAAERGGRNEEAATLKTLHRKLNAELDRLVPEFKTARQGAKAFFDAEDAFEAGGKFVTMPESKTPGALRALAKLNPAERMLFARGFASTLIDKIPVNERVNVVNSIFVNSEPARRKIEAALGPQLARQLEALLRVEAIVDRARTNLGNSTTARQLHELEKAGGLVAAVEGAKETLNPAAILTGAFLFGGLKRGAQRIDEKVARRVGEMLASEDPKILEQGSKYVSSSPVLMNALRRATASGSRVTEHDVGPEGLAAGLGTAYSVFRGHEDHAHRHHDEGLVDQLQQ